MRSLVVGLMAASLSTCGGNAGFAPLAGPPGKPPSAPGVDRSPPPAWVQTARGARWLGYSSFCWSGALRGLRRRSVWRCAHADAASHPRGGHHVPSRLQADRERHFPRPSSSYETARAREEPDLARPRRRRVHALRATQTRRGDASYTGCVRFD